MSYNPQERDITPHNSIQRQEYYKRVETEKAVLKEKVLPIFNRLRDTKTVKWNDQTRAYIDESDNNFDETLCKRNDLVSLSLLYNGETFNVGEGQIKTTYSEIRIASQDNILYLITDSGSTQFSLFPIDKEQLSSTITNMTDHPPIKKTINKQILLHHADIFS